MESKKSYKWIIMLLFPPYAFYLLIFKTSIHWSIKTIASFIFAVLLIAVVDASLNPSRVEDTLVDEVISNYLTTHKDENMGNIRKTEREGVFKVNESSYLSYKTLTTNGVYDFVILIKNSEYEVNGIYQTYPTQNWNENLDEQKLPPVAMIYLYENIDKYGELKSVAIQDEIYTLETTEGTYLMKFEKNKVVSITTDDGQKLFQEPSNYTLPKKVLTYFEKHEELGEITSVFSYEIDTEKESYHLRTSEGRYRVDIYDNGDIDLLEANE